VPASAGRDLVASLHSAWTHIIAPATQFSPWRPTPRAVKIWIGVIAALCVARINSRLVQSL